MKKLLLFLSIFTAGLLLKAQPVNCTFKPPFYTMHFGTGGVGDFNKTRLPNYRQVFHSCPVDGNYAYVAATSNCFGGDWHTLTEDHTPGEQNGNMMLVNASYYQGAFLSTIVSGFKGGTTYRFGAWMINLCRITKKCPSLLLPNITIRLQSIEGKTIAEFTTGELQRVAVPHWRQYQGIFTMPPATTTLKLTMIDQFPSGCGNDFALDDITFQECIKTVLVAAAKPKTSIVEQRPAVKQKPKKKLTTATVKTKSTGVVEKKHPPTVAVPAPILPKQGLPEFPPTPSVLTTRTNTLVKRIETTSGDVKIDLYDNGEIDGDTISVYHNNQLVVARTRLSATAITFHIKVDAALPHHELVMVANNLGSIPPNTSLMIVTAGGRRYEVFISSSKQQNAKVTIDLK